MRRNRRPKVKIWPCQLRTRPKLTLLSSSGSWSSTRTSRRWRTWLASAGSSSKSATFTNSTGQFSLSCLPSTTQSLCPFKSPSSKCKTITTPPSAWKYLKSSSMSSSYSTWSLSFFRRILIRRMVKRSNRRKKLPGTTWRTASGPISYHRRLFCFARLSRRARTREARFKKTWRKVSLSCDCSSCWECAG